MNEYAVNLDPVISTPNHMRKLIGGVTSATVAGALLLGACGGNESGVGAISSDSVKSTSIETDGTDATTSTIDISGATPVEMNDQDLVNGGFHCGESGPEVSDYSWKLDLFSSSPEAEKLGASIVENIATDPTYGMTQEGFDFFFDHTQANLAAVNADKTSGNEDLDAVMTSMFDMKLDAAETFVNGTCRFNNEVEMPARDIPLVTLEQGGTVNVAFIDNESYAEWVAILEKNGQPNTFRIYEAPVMTLADGSEFHGKAVAMFFKGCGNPIRVPEETPTPDTVPTTVPETTPGTTPGTTTPETTPTTIPDTTTPTTSETTTTLADKVPVPLPGPNTSPGAGGSPEEGDGSDDGEDGYGPGDPVPTVVDTAAPTTTEADTATVTTGTREIVTTTTIANGDNGTPGDPIDGDPGVPA